MKKSLVYFQILMVFSANYYLMAQNTQELYIPYEIKQAYLKQTRSADGRPGKNYFQNKADYFIKASFFPGTNVLSGSEVITYRHNGTDSLSNLYINLYQNLYKKGVARDTDIDPVNIHDGVEIKSIRIDGTQIDPESFKYFTTILKVKLPKKITPSSETMIEIEWKQIMPITAVKRQGTYNKTNFFIAYWYPKIAVFDDIEGWNVAGHKGIAEFYSDFGNFHVEITVPSPYTIWSTGIMQNTNEIFTDKILERINLASQSDNPIQIITENDRKDNTILKNGREHTWKFKSENRADFAFAVSNQYLWDAASIETIKGRIFVHSVYSSESKFFNSVTEVSRKSIEFYSKLFPGIAFPYDQLTAFEGARGGMEFPGMINDEDYDNQMETRLVTSHEIGHMYFPFHVGINEQKYGWMDEGLVTFIGLAAFSDQIGDKELTFFRELGKRYAENANSQAIDVPLMLVSYNLGDGTSGYITYIKSTVALYLLYDYLGKEKFYQAITEFSNRWQSKHPTPYDMFFTFNQVAGEDLAWFWNPWFFNFGYADLGIGELIKKPGETLVQIKNNGNYPVPVYLTIKYKNGSEIKISKSMNIWKSGEKSIKISIPKGELKEIILNNEMIPESDYSNNKVPF